MTASPYEMAIREPVGLDRIEGFAQGLDHAEGIATTADGRIFVGGEGGQVYAIEGDSFREVANLGGFVLGLAADGDGLIYACQEERQAVVRLDPESGEFEDFSTGTEERPMRVPNWLAFDGDGNLYVSDSGDWQAGDGLIWVVRPGRRAEVFSEEPVDFPNGLAVAPDGSRLYAVESTPGRIIEIPIGDDGSAGPRRVLCELGLVVPDGIAVAADGSLVIACYRPDVIFRWSEGDGLEVLVSDPQGTAISAPTNVAFTGDDLEEMVVPNLAGWHLIRGRLGVKGTPLFRPSTEVIEGG